MRPIESNLPMLIDVGRNGELSFSARRGPSPLSKEGPSLAPTETVTESEVAFVERVVTVRPNSKRSVPSPEVTLPDMRLEAAQGRVLRRDLSSYSRKKAYETYRNGATATESRGGLVDTRL